MSPWQWDQRPYATLRIGGPTVTSVTDLEREYSPSSRVGGSADPFIADYVARSEAAAVALDGRVVTGSDGSRWVAAGAAAPLLVFVHGGYWQALSARDSMYLAPGALAAGWSYAALEYTLAPAATLPQMVEQCRAALAAVAAAVPHSSLVVAGHSAGAHLVAMVTSSSAPPVVVDRVVLLSGVYDLRPLVHTTVNEPLGLDVDGAADLSPLLLPVRATTPTLLAVGEVETEAFHAQTHRMATRLRVAGAPVTELLVAARHHFDIVDDLVDPTCAVGAFTLGGSPP